MDIHFSEQYDPSRDIHKDPEESDEVDDWGLALEAVRDRAKWKSQGAERLREAGFSETEVGRWKATAGSSAGREKDDRDVVWSRSGEGREWDRGKIFGDKDDGLDVEVKAEWGRLKGM